MVSDAKEPHVCPLIWQVGRGMRTSPSTGKKDCLVLDFTVSAKTGMHISPTLRQFAV
jgi:superfamily II DNA or RNA helicase